MENFYLQEAFKKLELLNEEAFDLSVDAEKLDDLREFVADDVDPVIEEPIIDLEAETECDLKDGYIGKVILECDCCHTRIYKDIKDVVIGEDGKANEEEECPVCNGAYGWNVIGKIEEFNKDANIEDSKKEEKTEEDSNAARAEEEFTEKEFGEALKEALSEGCHKEEGLGSTIARGALDTAIGIGAGFVDDMINLESLEDVDAASEDSKQLDEKSCVEGMKNDAHDNQIDVDLDKALDDLSDEEVARLTKISMGEGMKNMAIDSKKDKDIEDALDNLSDEELKRLSDISQGKIKEGCIKESDEEHHKKCKRCGREEDGEDVVLDAEDLCDVCHDDLYEESIKGVDLASDDSKKLDESVDEVEVKSGDKEVEVKSEDGKITVEVKEESEEEKEVEEDAETIAPLSGEEVSGIESNEPESDIDADVDDSTEEVEVTAEDDLGADEFDEESFDELGESYLRRVYENVKSYNTTKVNYSDHKLVVEGLITFDSGKQRPTSFVFEKCKETRRGKKILEGHNDMFSESNRSFRVKGLINESKFVCETFVYDYCVNTIDESNDSVTTKICGRIKR